DEYYPPEAPRSTTRAVAWGALLFSTLALLISLGTLFLTWHNGELVKNATMLSQALSEHWHRLPSRAAGQKTSLTSVTVTADENEAATATPLPTAAAVAGTEASPIATNATEADRLESIRNRLDQLAAKVSLGQTDAPARLEQLRREMEGLSHYASDAAGK